jgi:hypothetical protein
MTPGGWSVVSGECSVVSFQLAGLSFQREDDGVPYLSGCSPPGRNGPLTPTIVF